MSADKRKLYVEETNGRSFRTPTDDEIKEALAAEEEREALLRVLDMCQQRLVELSQHPSKVFYDSAGFPYDLRHFIASGKMDLI